MLGAAPLKIACKGRMYAQALECPAVVHVYAYNGMRAAKQQQTSMQNRVTMWCMAAPVLCMNEQGTSRNGTGNADAVVGTDKDR